MRAVFFAAVFLAGACGRQGTSTPLGPGSAGEGGAAAIGRGGAGSGGSAGALPGTSANPSLADVCAGDGKLQGVVAGLCPLHADSWEWDQSVSIYGVTADQSSLPSCPMDEESDLEGLDQPGWRLRIDRGLGTSPAGRSLDHFNSVYVATRLDGPAPCAVRLVWKLKQQAVKLDAGTVVRLAQALTIRSVEDDVSSTTVLRNDEGQVLLGFTSGARPEVWETKVWPELSLAIDAVPVCQDAAHSEIHRLHFTLTASDGRCTLEATSARCCTLQGGTYLVMASDAVRDTSTAVLVNAVRAPLDSVTLVVARQGLLITAP